MDSIENRNWLTEEETELFVGKNCAYYYDKWGNNTGRVYRGWNWAAMFFNIEWMIYRKMYIEALLTFVAMLITGVCFKTLFAVFGIVVNAGVVVHIFRLAMGFFGNALYEKKALRVLRKTIDMDDSGRACFLSEKGGVEISVLVIWIVICFVIEWFVSLI